MAGGVRSIKKKKTGEITCHRVIGRRFLYFGPCLFSFFGWGGSHDDRKALIYFRLLFGWGDPMMISWERLFSLSFSLSAFFFLRVPLGPTRNGQKEEGGGALCLVFSACGRSGKTNASYHTCMDHTCTNRVVVGVSADVGGVGGGGDDDGGVILRCQRGVLQVAGGGGARTFFWRDHEIVDTLDRGGITICVNKNRPGPAVDHLDPRSSWSCICRFEILRRVRSVQENVLLDRSSPMLPGPET